MKLLKKANFLKLTKQLVISILVVTY